MKTRVAATYRPLVQQLLVLVLVLLLPPPLLLLLRITWTSLASHHPCSR
jgi:hypothetical protein